MTTQVEAAPRSVNYWMKVPGGAAKEPEAVNPGRRVSVAEVDENAYTQRMVLRLAEVRSRDFGTYICIARNSLGEVRTTVQLQGEIYYSSTLLPLWQTTLILGSRDEDMVVQCAFKPTYL